MPSMLAMTENNMPTFKTEKGLEEQVRGLYDYLYQLMEEIRYSWRNIDPEKNFNQAAKEAYEQYITDPIYVHLEDTDGNVTDLQVTAKGLWLTCYGADGTPENPVEGSLSFTAREFNVFYHDEDGDWSQMTQTAEEFRIELYGDGKNKAGLVATAEGLQTEVYGEDGHSGIKQTAEGVWAEVYGDGGSPTDLKVGCMKLTCNSYETFMQDGGDWSKMTQTADGLLVQVFGQDGSEGNAKEGSLRYTADQFTSFMGKDGAWSKMEQTAESFSVTLYGDGKGQTGLVATAQGLYATVYGGEGVETSLTATQTAFQTLVQEGGRISKVEQKAGQIDWVVKNELGATSTNFKLTDRTIQALSQRITLGASNGSSSSTLTLYGDGLELTSADINFTGVVTFNDLNPTVPYGQEKQTIIDGGVIIAGSQIESPVIHGGTIYGVTICWGDWEYQREAYGLLGYGKGYDDVGQTEVVCIQSNNNIRIYTPGAINMNCSGCYFSCVANKVSSYVTVKATKKKTTVGLIDLIKGVINDEYE